MNGYISNMLIWLACVACFGRHLLLWKYFISNCAAMLTFQSSEKISFWERQIFYLWITKSLTSLAISNTVYNTVKMSRDNFKSILACFIGTWDEMKTILKCYSKPLKSSLMLFWQTSFRFGPTVLLWLGFCVFVCVCGFVGLFIYLFFEDGEKRLLVLSRTKWLH